VALYLIIAVPLYFQFAFAAHLWPRPGGGFEPLGGAKLFLLIMPLVMPRRVRQALALQVAMAALSVWLYYDVHLNQMRDRSPLAEPWLTLMYFAVGVALVWTRENRRVISLRLMRADAEVAARLASTRVSLQLLDELGSALQVLTASVELLRAAGTDAAALAPLEQASARLVAAKQRIPTGDADSFLHLGESLQRASGSVS
jgi:hypothetical protein